ncbi:MAG: ECF RNA polymerase sigma factor SigM [Ardenticatenaceae bacterium]|nr:MAG: ECF RNA polymerase sigma factor SigM [Ardenticatenaceae bacterium]
MLTFQALYEMYIDDVYRFVLWLSGNRLEAEDISSETFINAWTHKATIRTETLKAYLFTIARNIYLERQRKGKRFIDLEDVYVDPVPSPDQRVDAQRQLKAVVQFLQTVSEIDRTVFILRTHHELPYAEIARMMSLSETAVKVKVHRLRKKLIANRAQKEVV